jgi:hypothetical protein
VPSCRCFLFSVVAFFEFRRTHARRCDPFGRVFPPTGHSTHSMTRPTQSIKNTFCASPALSLLASLARSAEATVETWASFQNSKAMLHYRPSANETESRDVDVGYSGQKGSLFL